MIVYVKQHVHGDPDDRPLWVDAVESRR